MQEGTLGMIITIKPSHIKGMQIGIVKAQDGRRLANLMIDYAGISCDCRWPKEEGKCVHRLLAEKVIEGKK